MAWDSDTNSANQDDLDSTPSDTFSTGKVVFGKRKKGFAKISSANTSGSVKVSKGIGSRKSTSAPRGSGRKGSTTKANALKNA